MKKIIVTIMAVAFLILAAPGLHAQLNSGVVTNKWVEQDGSGNYTLTLETYVTGKVAQQATEVPVDIVIAMDYSGSMKKTGGYDTPTFNAAVTKLITGSGTKGGSASKAWTYTGLGYGNTTGTAAYQLSYYYEPDHTWYPVRRSKTLPRSATSTTNDVRAFWIVTNSGETWYLRGTGLSDTYDTSIRADNVTIFTGELRKGWRYYKKIDNDDSQGYDNASPYYGINYGNTAGTANNQWYYKHTDGQYYPVRRSNTLPDSKGGNTARALWVVIDGSTKYLTCSGLADDYDHTIVSDKVSICFIPLYKGWSDATITAVETDYGVAGNAGGHYYKHTDDKYYPVKKEQLSGDMMYQAYIILSDGSKWYLNGDGISQDPFPYSKNTKVSLYFGNLYTVKTVNAFTKYEGLKRAVTGFVDALYAHSQEKGLHHRVALTMWGGGIWYSHDPIRGKKGNINSTKYYYNTSNSKQSSQLRLNVNYPNLKEYSASGKTAQSVRILKDFRDILATNSRTELKNEFAAQPTKWQFASDPYWGLQLVDKLFEREGTPGGYDFNDVTGTDESRIGSYEKPKLTGDDLANYDIRPKIVIFLSDGEYNSFNKTGWIEDGTTYYGKNTTESQQEIQRAVTLANSMKAKDIKIYVLHVNTKVVNNNERAISSGPDYLLTATEYNEELLNAMLSIVQDIDGAAINLGTNAIVQDVVTKEFSVPGNISDIEVYTSACTGVDENSQLTFDDTLVPFDASVTKQVNADGTTTIQVSNYDYAADDNWCGKRAGGSYAGHKLVLKIPIVASEDLVGGYVYTNTTNAVVIDGDGNTVQVYPRPQVGPFPVHLKIAKEGLLEGESAVFHIYRKPLPPEDEGGESGDEEDEPGATTPDPEPSTELETVYETTPIMTVILTGNAEGTEVTADIVGLDPGYYYKIVEANWGWKYDPNVSERNTETQFQNPFRFVNTLRDETLPKSAEDIKRNMFF